MNPAYLPIRTTRSHSQSGMTLIEVMIASFVLLIVFVSVLSATDYAAKVANSSRAETAATVIINTKVEEMRAMAFADVEKYLAGSTSTPPRSASGNIVAGPCKGGTWRRTVTKESGRSELLRAVVAVEWTELGRPRRLEVVTFLSKHGIINKPNAATSPGTKTPGTS